MDLATLIEVSDKHGDGLVTPREFHTLCKELGIDTDAEQNYFRFLDVNRDGMISADDDQIPDGYIDQMDHEFIVNPQRSTEPYANSNGVSQRLEHLIKIEMRNSAKRISQVRKSESAETIGNGNVLCTYSVPILNLPMALEGATILHISDIHFLKGNKKRIDNINNLGATLGHVPDVIVCTGDYIKDDLEDFTDDAVEALHNLSPESRKFFVPGNHDFFGKNGKRTSDYVDGLMMEAGYQNLTGRHQPLELRGAVLNFYGIDDALLGKPEIPVLEPGSRYEKNILITHNLDAINNSFPGCWDLILSGHLHSGEINLWLYDGVDHLIRTGKYSNLNGQRRKWKSLSSRTLSYVSPGFSTHHARINTEKAGATLMTLTNYHQISKAA